MVFFNCNACGESLKKNQVEKHYQFNCRKCEVLSCVDCGKEFWGNDYQQHVKCMTEEEKYSGKNYKPKPNANKGEAKQELWIQQVQQAVDKVTANPQLKQVLEKLIDYPNIPRKKPKFINFLGNSLRVRGPMAEQVWDKISAEISKPCPTVNNKENTGHDTDNNETATVMQSGQLDEEKTGELKKLSKRERKEERRKKAHKGEKKDISGDNTTHDESSESNKKHKKSKKRKHEDNDLTDSIEDTVESELSIKKKKKNSKESDGLDKKKRKSSSEEENEEECLTEDTLEVDDGKFSWEATIIGVLKAASDNEISIKRLRKKVLAEYAARGGDGKTKTEEKLLGKFNKKVKKNPRLRVLKDRVKLLH